MLSSVDAGVVFDSGGILSSGIVLGILGSGVLLGSVGSGDVSTLTGSSGKISRR